MDAHDGSSNWKNHHAFYYGSTDQCKDLCDTQSNCLGFLDNYQESPRFCAFKRALDTRSSQDKDFYEKAGSSGGSNWPSFPSATALSMDPWGAYFRNVYGILPPFAYPFFIGDLWHFYDDIILSVGASAPALAGNCPSYRAQEGERYRQNNAYQPSGISYSWHAPPYSPFPANTWVEVSHQQDPYGDEHYGMWFLYAMGNGIWFHTGQTAFFDHHAEAYAEFGIFSGNYNEDLSKAAAAMGLDSLQFVAHRDHPNYPCDNAVGASYMNVEIVAVKLSGTYSCGTASGAPSGVIAAGWQGSKVCNCDNSRPILNCGIVKSQARVTVV